MTTELPVTETAPSPKDDTKRRRRRITFGLLGLILVGAIVGITVYFTTRPENLEVTQTTAEESLPSLIKAAMIGQGALLIEYTELLEDKSTLFHYVTSQGLDFATTFNSTDNDDNIVLYLTQTSEPTLDDLSSDNLLRIGEIDSVTFPYRLPGSFLPDDYNGVLLIGEKEEGNDEIRLDVLAAVSFKIADPEQVDSEEQNMAADETSSSLLPPNLVSNLESQRYNVDGTITIDYVMRFQDGEIVTVPRLRFNIPEVIRAPGPFLYLSKRPFSETSRRGSDLNDEDDIAIDIDEVSGGGFTVEGMFDQILDEIDDVQDLNEFVNGSWIVWCRPFGIWLGGGPISIAA